MKIVLILIAVCVFILTGMLATRAEAKRFNHGICPRCNTFLRYFDTDSQGGNGYTCDKCNYTTWVSYHSVDKDFKRT